ncbi:MAG: L,D-transpeptidase [Hyphomicrobium sp.]
MKRLSLAAALLALAGLPNSAQAFQGSYDAYGYQMPTRGQKAAKPAATFPSIFAQPKAPKNQKLAKASADSDEAQVNPGKKKKQEASGGGELSGGPRPSIGAVAPPKVAFSNGYGAGSIVIDTAGRKLYYVLSSSQAYRYPIAVGKDGFKWTGTHKISNEADWPDWRPPAEMRERKPGLPEVMTGGIRNPLGAKALYLGNSLYRIHGTNDVKSIGTASSSGCFRMMNGHVVHLASIAGVGTTVRVLSKLPSHVAAN